MASAPNIPDPIRERLIAQQKRLKFVRVSFAVTAVLAVAMMFGATAYQGLAPSFRVVGLVEAELDNQGRVEGLLVDQLLDSASAAWEKGSFRFARFADGQVRFGRQFEGVLENVTMLPGNRAAAIFREQMVEYDLSGEPGPDWPRAVRPASLAIAEHDGSPRAALLKDVAWLCWTTGTEVLVRPLLDPDVAPAVLVNLERPGAVLDLTAGTEKLYLTVQERKSGRLTLYWFKPRVEERAEQAAAARAPENALVAATDVPRPEQARRKYTALENASPEKSLVGNDARLSALACSGGTPLIAMTRRADTRREWEFWRLTPPSEWAQLKQRPPAAGHSPLSATGFMSLTPAGDKLAAIYGDGGTIKFAVGSPQDGEFTWESREIALEAARGMTTALVWLGVFAGMLVLLAGQGVWLLLNRQQELDKTLAGILAAGAKDTRNTKAEKAKAEPRLLYANHFARGLALLIDLLATSPVVILLKQVYGYEWSQAYGFLYFGPLNGAEGGLLPIVQATLVTLSVLAAYALFCELMWGRTLGKALLHLRVVNADGEQPAGWQIVVRNVMRILELAHWSLVLVPLGLMLLTGKQQRLGDILARTYVIVDVAPEEQADDIDIG